MYFELSRSKRVKELSFEIAYTCALKILMADEMKELPDEITLNNDEV